MISTENYMMSIINKNLSYKDRRAVIDVITESRQEQNRVFANIGKYFFKKLSNLKITSYLTKYNACKGDVKKFEGYQTMMEALQRLKSDQYPDVSKNARIVEEALFNLQTRKKSFEIGLKLKESELSKMVFGGVLKACVSLTSLLVSESYTVNSTNNNRTPYNHMGFEVLEMFNNSCKSGTVDKMLRYENNIGGHIVKEGLFSDAIGLGVSVASALITGIRSLVYWVYYTRIDLADYLEQQAAYIEINKIALQNRTDISDAKKKEIIKKQTEWQQRLLNLSDKIQVDDIKAARKAKEAAEKDAKDMKSSDALNNGKDSSDGNSDEMPDFF